MHLLCPRNLPESVYFLWFHFFLRNPLFNIERVHSFVMSILPQFLLQQCAVFEQHDPFGPGYDSCALTTPPTTLSLRMYALTRSSYCSSLSGRPRGEYGKTLSVFLLGLPWKSVCVLRVVLSVTSLPKSSLKWQATFAGPFLIAERAIYEGDGFFHFSITQSSDLCFLNCMFSICVGSGMAGALGVRFSNFPCLTQFNIWHLLTEYL